MKFLKIIFIFLLAYSGFFLGAAWSAYRYETPCPVDPKLGMAILGFCVIYFGIYLYRDKWTLPQMKFKKKS